MKEEKIAVNNFIEALELLHLKNDEYDVLIDFHDRKKWILSNKITVHLIPHEKYNRIFEWRDGITHYIRNSKDNSIEYICNIRGRYEYYVKGWLNKYSLITHLGERGADRNYWMGQLYKNSDNLIDNGKYINNEKNRERYECPYTIMGYTPYEAIENPINEIEPFNPWIIEKRRDGGVNLYDKETKQLEYICNIGKRYEYIFNDQNKPQSLGASEKYDIIVQIIHDNDRNAWYPIITSFPPDKNPYIVRKRDDGGVDLLSKEDGALKYICNIGKRFYYHPYTEGRMYY
jgi:hypothetical protein